jgi:hypothetical protein
MTTHSRPGLPQALFIAALVSASSCSTERTCTTASCDSGATMSITFLSPPAGLVGGTVTVCRNGVCHSGTVPTLPGSNSALASMAFGDAPVRGSLWQDVNDMVTLDIEWRESGQVQDGDHYVATLTDTTGSTSTLVDKTATYHKLAPNGEECGPICWRTEL